MNLKNKTYYSILVNAYKDKELVIVDDDVLIAEQEEEKLDYLNTIAQAETSKQLNILSRELIKLNDKPYYQELQTAYVNKQQELRNL